MVKLIKKFIYFDYTTTKIRKCINKGESTLYKLNTLKHPWFLLLQEMFQHRGISMIDTYLCGVTEPTFKSYKYK
jgi:hypothetical protein